MDYAHILLKYLFGTYLTFINATDYSAKLAYLGNDLSASIAFLVLIVFTAFTDKGKVDRNLNNWKNRIFSIVLFLITIVLVVTSLYISFTPVGLDTINGCQARYILPMLFPLMIFIGFPQAFNINNRIAYNGIMCGSICFLNYLVLWNLYISLMS